MNILQYHILKGSRQKYIAIILFCVISLSSLYAQKEYGSLRISFTDIRSSSGNILLALYDQADQWTEFPIREYHWSKKELIDKTLLVEIDSIPYGTYACAVMDDENRDFEMSFCLGLPLEGFGMSGNPSFLKLKKPDFDAVSFELDSTSLLLSIKLNYLNKNKKVK